MTESRAKTRPEDPALELNGITRSFGAFRALDSVSFRAAYGSVHALVGENGAGKTTLMRIAFGMLQPDIGEIRVEGRLRSFRSPAEAIACGIGMVHQHFMLIAALTVAENVALGGRGPFHNRRAAETVRRVGEVTGLWLDPSAAPGNLSVGVQQRVEIVKAIAHGARILILDEPTAVLTPTEARDLLRWMRSFAESGGAVVLITHKIQDALAYADQITVLRRGYRVLESPALSLGSHGLASAMLGEPVVASKTQRPAPVGSGKPIVRLDRVTVLSATGVLRCDEVSEDFLPGEIVGIAALEGAARELLRVIAGLEQPAKGSVLLPETIGFIPEDRQHEGSIPGFSLTENVALTGAGALSGRMDWATLRSRTAELMRAFDVRAADTEMRAADLSGGNLQKLILGRELSANPSVIVAENPTRGLDIRATEATHSRLRGARDAGVAIVLHSSDIDELVAISDRILVLRDGRLMSVTRSADTVGAALLHAVRAEDPNTTAPLTENEQRE